MGLKLRKALPELSGAWIGVTVERLSDGKLYDLTAADFLAAPTNRLLALSEKDPATGVNCGVFRGEVAFTPQSIWADGNYLVTYYGIDSATAPTKTTGPALDLEWIYVEDGDDGCNPPPPPPISLKMHLNAQNLVLTPFTPTDTTTTTPSTP